VTRGPHVQVQARFLVPGMTIVVTQGEGRHRRSGAGLDSTFYVETITAISNGDFLRVTGRQGNAPAMMDLKPTQVVKVQH
jgi:hypothetical protein